MKHPTVAIVIPHYNRIGTLRGCLRSIVRTAGYDRYRIVVVDGGSTDGSLEWLDAQVEGRDSTPESAALRDKLRVIRHGRRGVANAVNAALAITEDADDVVRVHSDVVFETDGWLARLVESSRRLERAGVITGKLVLPDDRIDAIGRSVITGVGIDDRHASRARFTPDTGAVAEPVEVDSAPGALMYITAAARSVVGGFDEAYWPHRLDDDDFCLSARHRGFKVYADPAVKAIHYRCGFTPTTEPFLRFGRDALNRVRRLAPALEDLHVDHWRAKWGFHPRHPDLAEIRRLYGDTEICWRIGAPMEYRPQSWPPSVDAVMVTWNNLPVLKRCLESLAATRYPADRLCLHVADNGSKDGTREYLHDLAASERFPFRIVVHELKVNTGVAVGFNWAIASGNGELVARLDDDVVVPPEWLETLIEVFRARPYAGVVGPKILNDNPIHDIQCGPFRMYPSIYGHENEPDQGQADYVARVVHVRGCLNVYRRDVLDRCGGFDLRYSPSQYDDPDHHVSLGVAGYEVLYDGRVGVIHAMNSGAGKTDAALTNQQANQAKLFGKWGASIWRTLERGIEMSCEGKYLPDDGDTRRFLATLADPATYPRQDDAPLDRRQEAERLAVADLRERSLFADEALGQVWEDSLEQARMMRRDGHARHAVPLLQSIADLQPWRPQVLHALAQSYLALGELDRAELIARRGRLIADDADLAKLSGQIARARRLIEDGAMIGGARPGDASARIGEGASVPVVTSSSSGLRVLMVNTFERRVAGGDMHQINKTAEYLRRLGHDVTVAYEPRPDPRGYDVIHAWNLWFPQQTMAQVKGLRVAAPDTPIVMTPIYWDMSEKHWADAVIPGRFEAARSDVELRSWLKQIATDGMLGNGVRRTQAGEPNFPGYEELQRETLRHVDLLLPNSVMEMDNMASKLGMTRPYEVVHNGAEIEIFDRATPDRFVEQFGKRDFILTVGLVENRKNQLMLLHALKGAGLPVVVVGRSYDQRYVNLCRRYAPEDTTFIEHLPHDALASAMKAARVFALPSWMECAALASVEAALAGCSLVVSNRTSEPEYFGRYAYFCDPADVDSIRDAVLRAYRSHEVDQAKRDHLREQFRNRFTWENAARQTVAGYERALQLRQGTEREPVREAVSVAAPSA